MYVPELIKEAKKLLTKDEINSISKFNPTGGGFNYKFNTRDKLTSKVCWFYPSVKNFNTILSLIEPNDKVLDIGCGSGIVGKYILDKYPNIKYKGVRKNVYGVDMFKYIPSGYIEELKLKDNIVKNLRKEEYNKWLLIYPPYDTSMGYDVLKEFLNNNSVDTLIFLGETDGCVGDDKFKELLGDIIYDTPDSLDVEFYNIDCYSFIRDELVKITKKGVKNV